MTLIIEICPHEPRVTAVNPDDYESDLMDCTGPGDAEPACQYVRDAIGVSFCIVARDPKTGKYENRAATDKEISDTCRAIYSGSDTDFSDIDTVAIYLIWGAAHNMEGVE